MIGSGPNGLVAACILAMKGWTVTVVERSDRAGGAVRSDELTAPGFIHDTYSAFYGMLHASPVLHELGLDTRIKWANFEIPVASVIGPDRAALCFRDSASTVSNLNHLSSGDGLAWQELYAWWLRSGRHFLSASLASIPSLRPTFRFAASTGLRRALPTAGMLLSSMRSLAEDRFTSQEARSLLACGASHADVSIDATGSVPPALILAMVAQEKGMPIPVGGASRLADELVSILRSNGGDLVVNTHVSRVIAEHGRAVGVETSDGRYFRARRAILADVGVKQLFQRLVSDSSLPRQFLDGVRRFRHGTGFFKMDMALSGPVPWLARGLAKAGVIHLTGDLHQMSMSMNEVAAGSLPIRPLLIVGQQTVADPTRAPAGKHTLWVETSVPSAPMQRGTRLEWRELARPFGDTVLSLLEDHAPGVSSLIEGLSIKTPQDLEAANPNLVGGDPGGGSMSLDQQLIFRPVPGWFRYRTPMKGLYLCSASAHPGGGVHGMVGRNCAERVLRDRLSPRRR